MQGNNVKPIKGLIPLHTQQHTKLFWCTKELNLLKYTVEVEANESQMTTSSTMATSHFGGLKNANLAQYCRDQLVLDD